MWSTWNFQEASDTLAKPIGMFDEKKKGGVGGLDDKEGESDSQFIRPNSGVEGRSQPDAKVLPSTNPNPLENGEDKAREQLQVDNTDDQQENQVDS